MVTFFFERSESTEPETPYYLCSRLRSTPVSTVYSYTSRCGGGGTDLYVTSP